MGLTLQNIIILFADSQVSNNYLQALLIHEYHHVCRLACTNETEESISLLESMIMEGLAEWAVYEELGSRYLASWTEKNDRRLTDESFMYLLLPRLQQKGRENYYPFLFGDEKQGIPQWLGYYFGYQLVRSAEKNLQKKTVELFNVSAESIFEASRFTNS